ncbi:MAG TPA: extracellular solute-binding protein [Spirochaetota bacterium]|nr:extracellular solute-binding protein [Spirochaetota bacterium]HPK56996.1 extracellular solute-binding protein [Spirochaetota bacterium]
MKRVLSALVLLTLVLSVACTKREKRSVTMWSFAANNVEEWKKRKADIDQKFNIDLQIELVAQNAFVQKLQAVMMDGKGVPDMIEWMIENNRILNADPEKSFVLPLDEFVNDSKAFKNVVSGRVAWVKYGEHTYGLPHDVHPVVLIYNDTLWKKAGVDVEKIETWDQFFEESKKLTAAKKGGKSVNYALPSSNGGLGDTMFMIWQQTGSNILAKDGKPSFTSPEFKEYVAKWLEWQKTGAFTMWDWGNFSALLKNGTLCSYTSPDWWVSQVDAAANDGKFQFKARALPAYKAGGPVTASWGGSFLAIPKGTQDAERIYEIMEYMQYDASAIKVRFEETGMLPPFSSVWGDAIFKKEDARFGGLKLGELQANLAEKMPSVNTGDIFWDALGDFGQQYTELASGKISLDDALKNAQEAAEKRIKK